MDFFRGPSEQLETAEVALKGSMRTYLVEVERKAAEERRLAEIAATEERERVALAAAKAAERGAVEEAQAIAEQMNAPAPTVLVKEAPKVFGISTSERWLFEVIDATAIPREYLVIDESRIRKVVTALKADCKIPGVRVYSEKNISAARG
jgi:hypothetical protein